MEAKKHIARFQDKSDYVFYDAESPEAKEIAHESPGFHVYFKADDAPVKIEETHLIGDHNLRNIAAAFKVAQHLGVEHQTAIEAIKAFIGLPHRLQLLGVHDGIEWVDDAISTTPESTIAALAALGDRVSTIILGGHDRGFDYTELGQAIAESTIQHVILFPESGERIQEAIPIKLNFYHVSNMEDAVTIAKENTPEGGICLLSTASPSYGMFKNFEEKGDAFRRCIEET
jgi:UDP-N-acetylmuramoylalanine--D-glutamate ligase